MNGDPLLLIASGSSSVIGLPDYLRHLREQLDLRIRVLLTDSAARFVRAEVVGWFADEVLTSGDDIQPTRLALTARAIVVLPATANIIAHASLGLAATPATTTLLSAPGPCAFFPVTNPVVWSKESVRRHVQTLRSEGHIVVDPVAQDAFEVWCGQTRPSLGLPSAETVTSVVSHLVG